MAKLNRIKAVLAEQERTSKWLAEQVGKSACTVSKWCSNRVQPDLNTLDKIAKILEVNPDKQRISLSIRALMRDERKAQEDEEKKTRKEERARTEKENKVIDAIIADSEIEIPEPMLKAQQEQIVDEFAQRLQSQGLSIDQYFAYMGMTREKMVEDSKEQAEKRIRTRLVLEEIVKVENIVATEEDFETELTKLAEAYGTDLDTVKKIFEGRDKDRMMEDIAVQKALSFVADNAVEK